MEERMMTEGETYRLLSRAETDGVKTAILFPPLLPLSTAAWRAAYPQVQDAGELGCFVRTSSMVPRASR